MNISIPDEIVGDPEYDGTGETLTFYGAAAIEIAKQLSEERERRERTSRANQLNHTIGTWIGIQSTRSHLAEFAQKVLDIYEVDR